MILNYFNLNLNSRAKRVLSVDSGIKSDNEVNENKDINEFGNFKSGTSIESMMSKYYEAMDDFDKSVNQDLKESAKRLFSPVSSIFEGFIEFLPINIILDEQANQARVHTSFPQH